MESARANDSLQLRTAIIKAGSAVGLDVTGLASERKQPFSNNHEDPIAISGPSVVDPSIVPGIDINTRATHPSRVEPGIVAAYPSQTLQTFSNTWKNPVATHYNSQSGRMSPRFNYGLWLDPARGLKIYKPPIDIAPYLGVGMYNVAGRINWACLDYGYACLQEAFEKDWGKQMCPESLPPNSASRIFVEQILRHPKPLHDVAFLFALLEAREEFRRLGYMRGDRLGANVESSQILDRRLREDFRSRGIKRDEYWSPLDVERYIQKKMGFFEFLAFQSALSCEEIEGPNMEVLRPLTATLVQSSTCLGDGPRWKVSHAMRAVDAWACTVGRSSISVS